MIRKATDNDLRYVMSSWAHSSHDFHVTQHYSKRPCRKCSRELTIGYGAPCSLALWLKLFGEVQKGILARSECLVVVDPDDASKLLGYAIAERGETPVLWYCQTKRDALGKGVAKSLLAEFGITTAAPCIYAFSSPIFVKLKRPNWTHVPWYLIPPKEGA